MLNKFLSAILLITLILPAGAGNSELAVGFRTLVPNEQYHIKTEIVGDWECDQPEISTVDAKGLVTAITEGLAVVSLVSKGKVVLTRNFQVTYEPEVPELIQAAIDLSINEWNEALGKGFERSNKYTSWYIGPKANFGWCGAFTSYSLGEAGVPQEDTGSWKKITPKEDGRPYGVREAGVPKLLSGYSNMDRLTNIPRPGYLVIYGKRGGYATVHVGLVTRVVNRGDGTYLLETVEGNLASRVKRLTYLYDSKTADPGRNIMMLPEEERVNAEVFQYRLSSEDWRITAFAQTWY